ncbi:MAG: molybdopterin-dependent oxidoreductase, partial [Thermomicrobiales bacterium]
MPADSRIILDGIPMTTQAVARTGSQVTVEREARRELTLLFLSGALAALVAVAFMLLLRRFTETDSLLEIIGEASLQAMPMALFSFLLRTLQEAAKPLLVIGIVAGMMLVGGGVARLDGGAAREASFGARFWRGLLVALSIWVPLAIFAVVVVSFGTVAPITNQSVVALGLILLADVVVFVLAVNLLFPLVRAAFGGQSTRVDYPEHVDAPPSDLDRRRLIALAATGAVALASTAYVGRFVSGIRGGSIGGGSDAISEPVTPNDNFYLISKNFVDPRVDAEDWRLRITGLVETPRDIAYADLMAMQTQQQLTTLTCISNEIGGELISNAKWTGVRLSDILSIAGIQPSASELALYADDGYTESFPLSKALEPTTMLAHLMNDEPLSSRHGFPARLIVPGLYGIKNVKWLTRIDLVASNFKGYWQQRG